MEQQLQSFSQLKLNSKLLKAIADLGYSNMTPIQQQAIPYVLSGKDVMGIAQTGTGKTAAFALPLVEKMLHYETTSVSPAKHPIRALILAPTRELAVQVGSEIKKYLKYTKLRCEVVFGGVDIKAQSMSLRAGVDILVATPGRLLDHINSKNIVFNNVEFVVLDEADRMLDIGFLPDLQRIINFLPIQRTTLLFSATFSKEIKKLAAGYLTNPQLVEVQKANSTAITIKQSFYQVELDDKRDALLQLLTKHQIKQAYIFSNSKQGCASLASFMQRKGLSVQALHGNKTQQERLDILQQFKDSAFQYLVATDVAARGLDIRDVPAVFNFDLPFNAEDYVHRIGRTGRAGSQGQAISLVSKAEVKLFVEIKKFTKQEVELLDSPIKNDEQLAKNTINYRDTQHNKSIKKSWRKTSYNSKEKYDPIFDHPYQAEEEQVVTRLSNQIGFTKLKSSINKSAKLPLLFRSK